MRREFYGKMVISGSGDEDLVYSSSDGIDNQIDRLIKPSLLEATINLRQEITDSNWNLEELLKIYLFAPVSDRIYNDGARGGYKPKTRARSFRPKKTMSYKIDKNNK